MRRRTSSLIPMMSILINNNGLLQIAQTSSSTLYQTILPSKYSIAFYCISQSQVFVAVTHCILDWRKVETHLDHFLKKSPGSFSIISVPFTRISSHFDGGVPDVGAKKVDRPFFCRTNRGNCE